MVLKPRPVFEAAGAIFPGRDPARQRIALLSAQGPLFNQRAARRLSGFEEVLLVCGRYEGVDERVGMYLADEEISICDYVLSGGELAAAVVIDTAARLIPGVLGNQDSTLRESFEGASPEGCSAERPGILDCPHYTRPAVFRGWSVPEVLLSGNHAEIRKWRLEAALEKTRRLRPDLLAALGPASGQDASQADASWRVRKRKDKDERS